MQRLGRKFRFPLSLLASFRVLDTSLYFSKSHICFLLSKRKKKKKKDNDICFIEAVDLKNIHNLKVESYVLLENFQDFRELL